MAKKREEISFSDKYIKWFSELGKDNIKIAGGKGANLGEMYNHRFPVPPGFVITADAFAFFISDIKENIKNIMLGIDFEDTKDLEDKSKEIRKLVEEQEMPDELKTEILESYHILGTEKIDEKGISQDALTILRNSQEPIFVSVRSSATTEDLADASFAGQQQSFLNVKEDADLIEFIKKCFSSLYTARAIYYRNKKGFKEGEALLAVVVQKMVDSEKSGVVFSKNPVNTKDEIVVEAVFGLGEGIVSGMINPDNYVITGNNVNDLKIKDIKVSNKKIAIVRSGSGENKVVKLSPDKSKEQVLTKGEILEIANYALKLEGHYSKPQDIEFAIEANKIYIVQSRPITTKGVADKGELSGKIILEGLGASPGIGVGNVRLIKGMEDLPKIKKGDVLVTEMTNPDMVVSMQKSVAIVTDEGGMTSHASIVSREMGIPCVVGTGEATKILKEGMRVTVDGKNGKIYEGEVAKSTQAEIKPVVKTNSIKIKVIVDLPEFAERAAKSEIDEIGLTRLEGIIASSNRHLLDYEKKGDLDKYTELLRKGLEKISKPFKRMWIRSSDIRTDEFGSLEGAPAREINPMLGLHGIRFSLKHPKIFEAELEAIRQIASEHTTKKFGVMFPQVISLEEVKQAKEIFNKIKTRNMEFGIMVETPAAVQIIESLCQEGIDFISFGTNDLTQFTLGVDRGDDNVQSLYNEMHPAVLSQIRKVISVCKRYNVETSICGQAGSNKEMVKFLFESKIDSISVNADAAYEVSLLIKELEESSKKIEEHKEQEIKLGFDKRKQEGLIPKKELNQKQPSLIKAEQAQELENKEKRMINCDKCGKEFRLRFRPKKGLPVYCKACYRNRKETQVPLTSQPSLKQEPKKEKGQTSQISKIDSEEHIKERIKGIQEELEEVKQQRLNEEKQVEQSIETEISESSEPVEEESESEESKNKRSNERDNEDVPQIYRDSEEPKEDELADEESADEEPEPAEEVEAEENADETKENTKDETEEDAKDETEETGDDFSLDSVGVYNPEEESSKSVEDYNYNNNEEKEFSDVF
ncbi:MAG: phosphoenolpyruvate synthase [Nanoarchaeota archaeon]|nr:phosphoenolpyruvate synthase [Nanoarchaeota archaeon]